MDFLQNIEEKTLIIADNVIKNKLLDYKNNLNRLVNIKIMNIDQFLNHYFFSYDEKTCFYLKNKYNLTIEMAYKYLNYLKYIIDTDLNDKKINYLKTMYLDLKNNGYLIEDNLFKEYISSINIVVLNKENLDNFSLKILNKYNVKYIDLETKKYSNNIIYHFKSIEDECAYVFNEISSLLKRGICYSNIKLIPLGNEYKLILKRFSYLYNIKLNNLEKVSIYATVETRKFLDMIKNRISKEDIYEYLKPRLNEELFNLFLKIINKYYFIDELYDVIDLIEYDLKNTYFSNEINKNAIDILNFDFNLINDNDYVFVLGFNLENIPKTYKDVDYFNDLVKEKLGLFSSFEMNKLEKNKVIKNIYNIKNLTISYKDNDPYNMYYKSNLIKELNLNEQTIDNINETSNLYNKIKLTNEFDLMLKYGTKFNDTDILINTYPDIPYLTYSNKWTGIDTSFDNITLSYSSINNYYHCAFRYYIENILKLNIYDESFKQFIGTMFHNILSHVYEENFNFETHWNNYLKDKEFSKKEVFYLKDLKIELKKTIDILKYQYKLTGLTNLKLENEITLKYDDKHVFKGIIDKIMFKEKENNTYISIIDYKTGSPKVNITNLKYGIDMQLPVYVHLILKSDLFQNPKIIGFYLQQILHNKSSFEKKKDDNEKTLDNLKLQGWTINNQYLVEMFDETYENSEMIKSMKVTKSGFSYYSKVLSEDAIIKLSTLVEDKVIDAFNLIDNKDFSINPKVIGGENIGCNYCKYQDLCFKTGKDLVYLPEEKDLSYLENN